MGWIEAENLSENISVFGSIAELNTGLLATFGFNQLGVSDTNIIKNYSSRMVDLLVEQFELSEELKDQLSSFGDLVQEIENAGSDFESNRNLLVAGGVNLDGLGEIVGESRNGRNDTEYRTGIQFRIFLNRSSGEIEVIQDFVKYVTGSSYAKLEEIFPAKCFVYFDVLSIPANFSHLVDSMACAGVKVYPVYAESGNIFGFDGEGGIPEDSNIRGYSELEYEPDDSGKYSELII